MKVHGQIEGAALENLTTDPTTTVQGRVYLNTTTGRPMLDDGVAKRALMRNDGKFVFGTDATAANNVRLHHAGVGILQFVPGNDTTAENAMALTLAQIGLRVTNLAAVPASGNAGRIYFNTATGGAQVDTGTAFLQFATLTGLETLTNKTLTLPKVDVLTVSDQASTPATPASGTLLYSKSGSFYKLGVDGLESQVGSASSGAGFNYLTNGDFESGVSTVQYATTILGGGIPAGTGPTISGSPGSVVVSAETTNPLRRNTSLKATAASSWTAGQGFTMGPAFVLQQNDLGKVLNVTVNYRVVSGGASLGWTGIAGTQGLQIAIYDVTNGAWVATPPGALGFNQSVGTGQVTATFQTGIAVGQQYQAFIFNTVTSTAAVTVLFDDMSISPNAANSPDSRPITLVAASTVQQNNVTSGSYVQLTGFVSTKDTAAGLSASNYVVNVSGDYYVSAYAITTGTAFAAGNGVTLAVFVNGVFTILGSQRVPVSGTVSLSPSGASLVTCKANDVVNIRMYTDATCAVSSANWSMTRIGGQSGNTNDARTVTFANVGGTPTTAALTSTANLLKYPSASTIVDDVTGYNAGTGLYTVGVSGKYRINAALGVAGTYAVNNVVAVYIYKNGVPIYQNVSVAGGAIGSLFATISGLLTCTANDTISIYQKATGSSNSIITDGSVNYFTVERITGPSAVAASESVNASYGYTGGTAVAANAVFAPPTRLKDSHNAYLNGIFTCPTSGQYRVTLVGQASASAACWVKKTGVGYGYIAQMSTAVVSGSLAVSCTAGDTLAVYTDTAINMSGTNTNGFISTVSFERTGN